LVSTRSVGQKHIAVEGHFLFKPVLAARLAESGKVSPAMFFENAAKTTGEGK